jgi:cyclic-di-GMP-binding protein
MTSQDTIKLRVPRQELDQSSFFDCDEKTVQAWVDALPMANLGETTRKLYRALSELNQVRVLPALRASLLDILRSPIYYVSRALTKHYLNQPIVLPIQASKVVDLAHAMHHQLAVGYTIVATHTVALGKRAGLGKSKQLIAKALHRAITDHTLNMQRHYQLYEPIDEGVWHNLHQFYCLARQHNILNQVVKDEEFDESTVEGSYVRALLIGCAKPNQLRQEDFMGIFKPLTYWADMCRIVGADMRGLFVIDPKGDTPPVYRELYDSVLEDHWLSLDTGILVMHLKRLQHDGNNTELKTGDGEHSISRDLLAHLTQAWSVMSKRTFMRMEGDDVLHVSVGLSATHHFVSGELSFESLVAERGASTFAMQHVNPFMSKPSTQVRHKDVWDSPYEANVGQTNVPLEEIDYTIRSHESKRKRKTTAKEKYPRYNVNMINSSAHGYCIEWPTNTAAHIKTGEVIGVKQPSSHNWSIGVIRWVIHNRNQKTQLGLELISPSASPYGARIIHIKGEQAEYSRTLVLPEIPAIKRPVTLLTPRVPFRVGQKVVLNQRGKEVQMTLCKKINDTGAYSQFEFRKLATQAKSRPVEKTDRLGLQDDDNEFDSLWSSL